MRQCLWEESPGPHGTKPGTLSIDLRELSLRPGRKRCQSRLFGGLGIQTDRMGGAVSARGPALKKDGFPARRVPALSFAPFSCPARPTLLSFQLHSSAMNPLPTPASILSPLLRGRQAWAQPSIPVHQGHPGLLPGSRLRLPSQLSGQRAPQSPQPRLLSAALRGTRAATGDPGQPEVGQL